MPKWFHTLILMTPALVATPAPAAEEPVLTGTWKVSIEGVKIFNKAKAGSGIVHHTPAETGPYRSELTVVIDTQDGFSFSGTKRSKSAEEPTAGLLSFDNERATMIDLDGSTTCDIVSPDELRCDYLEVNAENSNINRQVWKRQ